MDCWYCVLGGDSTRWEVEPLQKGRVLLDLALAVPDSMGCVLRCALLLLLLGLPAQ